MLVRKVWLGTVIHFFYIQYFVGSVLSTECHMSDIVVNGIRHIAL